MMFLRISPSARLARRHRPVGEHEAGDAGRRQVIDEVLHPTRSWRWRPAAARIASALSSRRQLGAPIAIV